MENTTNTVAAAARRMWIADLTRAYNRAILAEENADTIEQAWRLADVSERRLADLNAAKAGLPLPSVVARKLARARAAKAAATRAAAMVATVAAEVTPVAAADLAAKRSAAAFKAAATRRAKLAAMAVAA